ncbi:phasin family protein, partial [Alsobacter sp. SYSU M60028]
AAPAKPAAPAPVVAPAAPAPAPAAAKPAAVAPATVEVLPPRKARATEEQPLAFAFHARFATAPVGEVLPKAVQDLATTGLTQAREAYATIRQSAETMTTGLESSGHAASKGLQSFSASVLDAMQANADATLGFLKAMTGVRTLSEAIEIQSRHARQQFEAARSQAKTLAGIATKTLDEAAKPVRAALSHKG